MRMNLILEILDVPGQLVSILNPIGELGANVVTIVHKREIKAEEGKAAIQIAIEGERENLQAVIDRFKEMNIALIEVDDTVRKEKLSAILYGHIIDRDLRDTVDKINAVDGLVVSDLQLKLDGELKSTALITVELDLGKRDIAYILTTIRDTNRAEMVTILTTTRDINRAGMVTILTTDIVPLLPVIIHTMTISIMTITLHVLVAAIGDPLLTTIITTGHAHCLLRHR